LDFLENITDIFDAAVVLQGNMSSYFVPTCLFFANISYLFLFIQKFETI